MLFLAARWRGWRALPLLALCPLLGCSPDGILGVNEERDRNFQRARDAIRLNDYEGAAEYFQRALDDNPRGALIHLGYASLCEGSLKRYADAVYHYQRYLRLRPDDPKAEDIRRRVTNCTERLATTVPLVIRSESIARDLEALRRENQTLRSQSSNFLSQVHYWSNEVQRVAARTSPGSSREDFNDSSTRAAPSRTQPTRDRDRERERDRSRESTGARPSSGRSSVATTPLGQSASGARYHRIQRGDTLSRISRQYGVSVAALRAANPRLDERRLLPGASIRIPER